MNALSYYELTEWFAYFSIYPFRDDREDIRAGIIASTIANVNRGKGKRAFQPQDFIFRYGEKKQSWQSIYKSAVLWNMVLGNRGKHDS